MRKLLSIIFSGEFAFAMFLLVAYFKEGLTFVPEGVDATFVFFLITLFVSAVRLLKSPYFTRGSLGATALYSLLILSVFISYLYTDSVSYAQTKMVKMVIVTTWSLIGVFFIVRNRDSLKKFLQGVLLVSMFMAIAGLFEFYNAITGGYYDGRLDVMGMGYLPLGRTVSLGLIYLICYRFFSSGEARHNKYVVPAILFMFLAVLVGGARMPLLALLFVVILFSLTSFKFQRSGDVRIHKNTIVLIIVGSVLSFTISVASLNGMFSNVFNRMSSLFSGDDASAFGRVDRFNIAFDMIRENFLLGQGFGSFPLYFLGVDRKEYPHNIFIEIQAEMGILGTLSFIALLTYGIYQGIKVFKEKQGNIDYTQLSLIGMTIFFFLNANTTGDITDNRVLFAFIALMSVSPHLNSTKSQLKLSTDEGNPTAV